MKGIGKRLLLLCFGVCLLLCAAGCGGEEDKDAPWLPGAPEDTVTIPIEDGRTLKFEQVSDHTAQDTAQWTDYAVITCCEAGGGIAWEMQTDTVYGWSWLEQEDLGPYFPEGAVDGMFLFSNLCPDLSYSDDAYDPYNYTITAVDIPTGKMLWEAEIHNLYSFPTSLKVDSSGCLFINQGGTFLAIDSDGTVLERADIWRDNYAGIDIVVDAYVENGERYAELYSPEHGVWSMHLSNDWEDGSWGRHIEVNSYLEETDSLAWQQNYIEFVRKLNEDAMGSVITYHLVYIDEDEIPELLIYNTMTQCLYYYTWKTDQGETTNFSSQCMVRASTSLRYIEHENIWCDGVRSRNGAITFSFSGIGETYHALPGETKTPNDDGTFTYKLCTGDTKPVTEEAFYDYLNWLFDSSRATELDLRDGLTAEEVMEQLSEM